jgi:hypothetical protein
MEDREDMEAQGPGISFTGEGALALAEDLAEKVLETGFGTLSKTDLYDYILYLLNTHSRESFLTSRDNTRNALLLKVTPAKIKASKLNIYLKFEKENKGAETLARFIRQIAEGAISLKDHGEGKEQKYLRLTVEDPAIRFCLDGLMKELLGSGADLRLNNEILVIPREDFYTLLRYIIEKLAGFDTAGFDAAARKELLEKIEKDEGGETIKTFLSLILDAVAEIGGTIPFVPAESIKAGIIALAKKLKRRPAKAGGREKKQ